MIRREFLQTVAAGAAASTCALGPARRGSQSHPRDRAPRAVTRGICFDLFTLFDPRSVVDVAETFAPGRGAALCDAWRARQFEYCWLRAAAGRYEDFQSVTEASLIYAAAAQRLTISPEARRSLVAAYSELRLWPDARQGLSRWKERGIKLAPLANYAPMMLERLISGAGLSDVFDALISTDAARTFKPDPRAYELGVSRLGLRREEIVFAAFGGWDAAGARWFGYPTFWVNRLGLTREELDPPPDGTGPTLEELARFVDGV